MMDWLFMPILLNIILTEAVWFFGMFAFILLIKLINKVEENKIMICFVKQWESLVVAYPAMKWIIILFKCIKLTIVIKVGRIDIAVSYHLLHRQVVY